jgi:hypothetical protein
MKTANHAPPARLGRIRAGFVAACFIAFGLLLPAGARAAQPIWELRPYRIHVLVAPDASPVWTPRRLALVERALVDGAATLIGRPWNLEIVVAPPSASTAARFDIDQLSGPPPADWLPAVPAGQPPLDKLIVLELVDQADGPRVRAREWDVATSSWGPPIRRPIAAPAAAGRAAFGALAAAFSPQAIVRSIAGQKATLRIRAGSLSPRDARMARFQPGAVVRLLARGGSASADPLDEAFLLVDSVLGPEAVCSAVNRPLESIPDLDGPGSAWLALDISPTAAASTLQLRDAATAAPLVGFDVLARPIGGQAARRLGRAGRDGAVLLPATASALEWIEVRSGDNLVARLPLLMGWRPRVDLSLPLDEGWLAAQAGADTLRGRLADLVARQEILLARARLRAASAPDEARKLLDEARALAAAEGPPLSAALDQARQAAAAASSELQPQVDALWSALSVELQQATSAARIDAVQNQLFPPPAPPPEPEPAAAPSTDPSTEAPAEAPAAETPAAAPVPAPPGG